MNALHTHEVALGMARAAMLTDSKTGCSVGAWRDATLEICRRLGVPEPEDVLAWVSGGKATDKSVADWGQQFKVR